MNDVKVKLSGTYDSIEANKILEEIRSMGQNYDSIYQLSVQAEQKAETALNTTQTAINTVNTKVVEIETYSQNASGSADRASASERNAKASEDTAVASASSASTSETNAKASEELTVSTANTFSGKVDEFTQQLEDMDERINNFSSFSVGMILPYASNGDIPVGFLLCNGASVSKLTYPDLFEAIGYMYGGSGTYFNLPNLTDKFIEGAINAGTEKEAGLPEIKGLAQGLLNVSASPVYNGAFSTSSSAGNTTSNIVGGGSAGNDIVTNLAFRASESNAIYGNSSTVQPPALTMRYIIKAFAGASTDSTDVAITNVANDLVSLAGTSEIVASGDNYVRYANGLQICWSSVALGAVTFPQAFSDTPIVCATSNANIACSVSALTTIGFNAGASGTGAYRYIAIGKWK